MSKEALERNINDMLEMNTFHNVQVFGLHGDYQAALEYGASLPTEAPVVYLWLGSSIGMMRRQDAAHLLSKFVRLGMKVGDQFIIGIDQRNDPQTVAKAYNDSQGWTKKFALNGLASLNRLFKQSVFDVDAFEHVNHYNVELGRNESYVRSLVNQVVSLPFHRARIQIDFQEGERILMSYAYKYSEAEREELESVSGLSRIASWMDSCARYNLHMFEKPPFHFTIKGANEAHPLLPTVDEFREQWKAWDFVTQNLVPKDKVLIKPIPLRHPFLFYVGHIPAFLDIMMSKSLDIPLTEPAHFAVLFERGMDPDMEDPTKCHPCSKVPDKDDEWPTLESVLQYQARVRERFERIMASKLNVSGDFARALFFAFEHESYHLDTFLWIVLQAPESINTRAIALPIQPSRFTHADQLKRISPSSWCEIKGRNVVLGHNDPFDKDLSEEYGWDNESPTCTVPVNDFYVQTRPVSNGEYYFYLKDTNQLDNIPVSWRVCSKSLLGLGVLSVAGVIPLEQVLSWPVSIPLSKCELYAKHYGYRVGTEPELRLTLDLTQENPRTFNIGFRTWCPTFMDITPVDGDDSGKSDTLADLKDLCTFQGGWEITSTVFHPFPGFQTHKYYPGFSADFFDDKHYTYLGGSWSLHPRLAQRRSVRNWFQGPYPYPFSQFRCVRDA
jgi:hypothetical protein